MRGEGGGGGDGDGDGDGGGDGEGDGEGDGQGHIYGARGSAWGGGVESVPTRVSKARPGQ